MSEKTLEQSLSAEDVDHAVRRKSIDHPVLALLDQLAPQIRDYNDRKPKTDDNQEAQRYVRENFGFFVDGVEQLGQYSLEPLEIIAIWSRIDELGLRLYTRYEAAQALGVKYASLPLTEPAWDRITTKIFLTRYLPEEAGACKEDVATFIKRLDQIRSGLKKIGLYSTGGMSMQEFIDGVKSGTLSEEEQQRVINHQKALPHSRLLGEIGENFINGLLVVRLQASKYLSR